MASVDEDERLRKWLLNTAEREGAAVVHVDADEHGAAYAFSVGVWRRFGKPEVVVIGLPREIAHAVLSTYIQRTAAGERFVPGRLYEGFVEEHPVTFEKVTKGYYAEYFGSALLIYRDADFPALQLLMPTPDGHFPWHADAPQGFAEYQPVLTRSDAPESWVPGETGP